MSVVTRTAGNQFPTQPRIFIHFEHVNADMGNAGRDRLFQRKRPTLRGLVRQARNQIDVDVAQSRRPQSCDFFQNRSAFVQPAHRLRLLVHERLHAQTHAIHSASKQSFDQRRSQRPRRTLDRDLRIRRNRELLSQCRKNPPQLFRIEDRRRPAPQINRIHRFRQRTSKFGGHALGASDILQHARNIAFVSRFREYVGGEIAVAALGPAERHRDVEAQTHSVLYSMGRATLPLIFDKSSGGLM